MTCYDFCMDRKTIILALTLTTGIILAVAGTYYQTIILGSFEYYLEDESTLSKPVHEYYAAP
jgi:hypothetical protein